MLKDGTIAKIFDVPTLFQATINKDSFIIITKYVKTYKNKQIQESFVQLDKDSKVRSTLNTWHYLSNRKPYVSFNSIASSEKAITCGVPWDQF